MPAFYRIAVAFDGSENSLEACSAAARLARGRGTAVDVVTVAPALRGSGDEKDQSRKKAMKMMDEGCASISKEGVPVRRRVIETHGSVVDALVKYSSDKKCDLIVVGARGSGGLRRLLLGSVSSGVVTHASMPVLVARDLPSREGQLFGRVLVAVDGSESSEEAVGVAARVAKSTGAVLTIIHVIYIPAAVYSSGSPSAAGIEKEARKKAEEYLSRAKESAEKAGMDSKVRIVEDLQSPVRGITDYALKMGVDLIVLGTRGLGGFKRLLVGSVASGVVNYAHCSVLVVRGG